jgi:hypothetical protein
LARKLSYGRNPMMWIVKIALRAPYTFTVLAVLLLIGGALSTLQMAKDMLSGD